MIGTERFISQFRLKHKFDSSYINMSNPALICRGNGSLLDLILQVISILTV